MTISAKELCFNAWSDTLRRIRYKVPAYGYGETVDSVWNKLPTISQDYWKGIANDSPTHY